MPVLVAAGVVVIVALIAGLLVLTGQDEAEAEVFLEPVDYAGVDPFTESSAAPLPAGATTTTATTTTTAAGGSAPTVPSIAGSAPGLYGGTQNAVTCDVEAQIRFLQANPDKAAAFAGVLGITTSQIPSYLRSLTPVRLTQDTRVTNHGYRNGRATSLQSVLQAGTAVLVDVYGVPRVKCGCGNPLTPPVAQPRPPRYVPPQGRQPWPGWSPTTVVVVQQTVQVNVFVLVNIVDGGFFIRPAATTGDEDEPFTVEAYCAQYPDDPECDDRPPTTTSTLPTTIPTSPPPLPAPTTVPTSPPPTPLPTVPPEPDLGTGDVQVTLRWGSTADLDLAVTDPLGETVSFNQTTVSSGGQLDVDANASCLGDPPVENVFWPAGSAPSGSYTATVTYFGECNGEGPQGFSLTVVVDGRTVVDVSDTLFPEESLSYAFVR
jgi:hypothetical protein